MSVFTLTKLNKYEEEIKRSKFIVYAQPIQSVNQAMEFINSYSVDTATHNCWAYQIGNEYRFNDDGEPSGTAGKPILQAIQGQQLDGVAVLVIRWFGGVKLGTGGLIRAYGGCAAKCLQIATKIELIIRITLQFECLFTYISLVQSRLSEFNADIVKEDYNNEGVVWTISLPVDNKDIFIETISNITRGQSLITKL